MKCVRCGGFSSTQICWRCSQLPDAIPYLRVEELETRLRQAEADLAKTMDAVRAIYFAGYWHCDRPVDEVALWTALRDASGILPGQTGTLLGPDRTENVAEECAQIAENYGDVRVAAAIRALGEKQK